MNILIIGATSEIAKALARDYAVNNGNLHLVGRNKQKLHNLKKDLLLRGAIKIHIYSFEALNFASHNSYFDKIFDTTKSFDVILIAHGQLPNQANCEQSAQKTKDAIEVNGLSTIHLITLLTKQLERQQHGTLAVITSVAGDRGRQSNYVYGASKAMVSTFLEGLQQRFHGTDIKIIDIKPGLIDTPMTSGMEKGFLWRKPEQITKTIVKGIEKGKPVIYAPNYWRVVMLIIRLMPRCLFTRLKL